MLTEAGVDAVTAVTLSDEDVSHIARRAAKESDRRYRLALPGSEYDKRLQKLTAKKLNQNGIQLNFKVYLTKDVNAFALADGSVRVFSGLMDLMTDEELLFVIGHEIGHVVNKHSRKKVVLVYASSALRKGLASQENQIGQIARSTLGAFAEKLANAQFSQHEERQADDYGVSFLTSFGLGKEPAIKALKKFDSLARQHTFLSSHPEPSRRAERLASGDTEKKSYDSESVFKTIWNFFLKLFRSILIFIDSFI